MKTRIVGIFGALALLLSTGSVFAFDQRPIRYSGTFGCSFVNNAGLGFGTGSGNVTDTTCTGQDTFGLNNNQTIGADVSPSTETCTAPDGTPGTLNVLFYATFVNTYNFSGDQLWTTSVTGSQCISQTTGSLGGSRQYTIIGGSGFFTNATGTINVTYTGSYLALPVGSTGYFGHVTGTSSGTITP
jgi:hypothetical protein